MIYRVFLQDEKDATSPSKNPCNIFRIRSGEMLALCYTNPGWKPSLEEQLRAMDPGFNVESSSDQLTSKQTYEIAINKAKELRDFLSNHKGKPYVFIDVTSRGNLDLAKKLSETIHQVQIPNPYPFLRCLDLEI